MKTSESYQNDEVHQLLVFHVPVSYTFDVIRFIVQLHERTFSVCKYIENNIVKRIGFTIHRSPYKRLYLACIQVAR